MMQRFPWAALMRLGIVTLNLPPREFWSCTLREIVLLRSGAGIARGRLDEMMKEWPD